MNTFFIRQLLSDSVHSDGAATYRDIALCSPCYSKPFWAPISSPQCSFTAPRTTFTPLSSTVFFLPTLQHVKVRRTQLTFHCNTLQLGNVYNTSTTGNSVHDTNYSNAHLTFIMVHGQGFYEVERLAKGCSGRRDRPQRPRYQLQQFPLAYHHGGKASTRSSDLTRVVQVGEVVPFGDLFGRQHFVHGLLEAVLHEANNLVAFPCILVDICCDELILAVETIRSTQLFCSVICARR
jgi:hypothetical protein